MLISELPLQEEPLNLEAPGPLTSAAQVRNPQTNLELEPPIKESVVAHLDKSHITVHTYPEAHPTTASPRSAPTSTSRPVAKFRALRALNYLIHKFESDIVIIDYRVRGFTRDVKGTKHYIDHKINSVQNFVDKQTLARYQAMDVNVYQENIFHTKMMLKDSNLDNYLFGVHEADLSPPRDQGRHATSEA